MPRIRLIIEYDGKQYHGWQKQKNSKSIQGEIEKAFEVIYKKRIVLTGSGRTDSGVHARNQVAHCDIPDIDFDGNTYLTKLTRSLNGLIDKDIVVKKIESAAPGFHSRFDAKSRVYRYFINRTPSSIDRNYAWYVPQALNLSLMQKAADNLMAVTDFRTFCKTGSSNKTTDCLIKRSAWLKKSDIWIYEIEANRFLYGMVRGIVGTLTALGSGKITYDNFIAIIENTAAKGVSFQAPAQGLFLDQVKY